MESANKVFLDVWKYKPLVKDRTITEAELLDLVKALFVYDAEIGRFRFKVDRFPYQDKGAIAGWDDGHGYRKVSIFRRQFLEHKIVWLYHYGKYHVLIDHINGDSADNRLENLREVTPSENNQNMVTKKGAYIGVFHSKSKKNPFFAQITHRYKRYHLGLFPTKELAAEAYAKAKKELHKFDTSQRTLK